MGLEIFIAETDLACQNCSGNISPGQKYWSRGTWHAEHTNCAEHTKEFHQIPMRNYHEHTVPKFTRQTINP